MRLTLFKPGLAFAALIFLLFVLNTPDLNAQERTASVKGVVTNNNGDPLSGVSVIARNTKTNSTEGTSTDNSGNFAFSQVAPGGPYNFTFSNVGYENQTLSGYNIQENAPLSLSVKMKESSATLDQVVVVGYGTQRRKDLTGSVASVGSKDLKDLPVTRIEQALSGRAAGVQVKFANGQPGAAPQIRIRGIGSISAGVDPLFVVDGFPTDNIQTLNPNDIESLDILKDASATAIYGSRGSNGVVIINTKRGVTGKAKINLDTYYGVQEVITQPKFMNAMQQAEYYYNSIRNRNLDMGNNVSGDPANWGTKVPQTVLDVLSGKNTNDVTL